MSPEKGSMTESMLSYMSLSFFLFHFVMKMKFSLRFLHPASNSISNAR